MQEEKLIRLFLDYIGLEKRFSKHTVTAYKNDLRQYHEFQSSSSIQKGADSYSRLTIREWIYHLNEQGLSNKTILRKLSSLKSYFNFLIRRGILESNPCREISGPKIEKRLPNYISSTDLDSLIKKVFFPETLAGQREKAILTLFYSTGMRRAELISLRVKDVDFSRDLIKVFGKGKKQRLIPITGLLRSVLLKYLDQRKDSSIDSDFLFYTAKGSSMYPKMVYRMVYAALEKVSSVSKKSPHVLRHSFATHLVNNGADINAIKELLGHSSLAATQVYTHNSFDQLKKIYNQAHPKA